MILNKLLSILSIAKILDKLSSQVMRGKKPHQHKSVRVSITSESKRADVEFIGKPAKFLNHDEMEEWFEGAREFWQENY